MLFVSLFLAGVSFERRAAYQVGVPQQLLEASGVESIHGVLCNTEQREVTLVIRGHDTKPGTCNMSWGKENISQNGFPG